MATGDVAHRGDVASTGIGQAQHVAEKHNDHRVARTEAMIVTAERQCRTTGHDFDRPFKAVRERRPFLLDFCDDIRRFLAVVGTASLIPRHGIGARSADDRGGSHDYAPHAGCRCSIDDVASADDGDIMQLRAGEAAVGEDRSGMNDRITVRGCDVQRANVEHITDKTLGRDSLDRCGRTGRAKQRTNIVSEGYRLADDVRADQAAPTCDEKLHGCGDAMAARSCCTALTRSAMNTSAPFDTPFRSVCTGCTAALKCMNPSSSRMPPSATEDTPPPRIRRAAVAKSGGKTPAILVSISPTAASDGGGSPPSSPRNGSHCLPILTSRPSTTASKFANVRAKNVVYACVTRYRFNDAFAS